MAVQHEGTYVPESTNAVETPGVYTVTATDDNTSTGAVDGPAKSETYEFGPDGQQPTDQVPNPEPYTIQAPGVKVVRAPRRQHAEAQTQAETPTRSHRADTGQIPQSRQSPDDGR